MSASLVVITALLFSQGEAFTVWARDIERVEAASLDDVFATWESDIDRTAAALRATNSLDDVFTVWRSLCKHQCGDDCECDDDCDCTEKCECINSKKISNKTPKSKTLKVPEPAVPKKTSSIESQARPSYPVISSTRWGTMIDANGRHVVWTKANLIDHLTAHKNHIGRMFDREKLQLASLEELASMHADDHNNALKSAANWYMKNRPRSNASVQKLKDVAIYDNRMAVYREETRTVKRCRNGVCYPETIRIQIFDHWLQ